MKTYSVLSVDGNVADDTGLAKSGSENYVYLSHEMMTTNGTDFINLIAVSSGTSTNTNATATVNNLGIARISSSTTANSGINIRSGGFNFLLKGNEVYTEIINPVTFTNTTHRAGIHDSTTSSDANNGVYFQYDGSGAIVLKTADNGTRTTSSTITTLVVGTWYKLRITVNSNATSVLGEVFNASGVLIASATNTTNIPTSARILNLASITTNSGTTALALLDIDFMSLKTTLTR
jgi:hypothetical protein